MTSLFSLNFAMTSEEEKNKWPIQTYKLNLRGSESKFNSSRSLLFLWRPLATQCCNCNVMAGSRVKDLPLLTSNKSV